MKKNYDAIITDEKTSNNKLREIVSDCLTAIENSGAVAYFDAEYTIRKVLLKLCQRADCRVN